MVSHVHYLGFQCISTFTSKFLIAFYPVYTGEKKNHISLMYVSTQIIPLFTLMLVHMWHEKSTPGA